MTIPHILVHNRQDNVGVVVVEGLQAGTDALVVVIDGDTDFLLPVQEDVPIGHKVALFDLSSSDTAIKYGEDIGRLTAAVAKGERVHTHNLKTKRW